MSSSLFEIVELPDGCIGLRRAGDDDSEPLVTIKFSSEAESYLNDARFEVVKAMIEAGLETVGELAEQDYTAFELESEQRTLH
ncbi:hypothetical protein HBA55_16925 [Pseudomaricurvus alkylphenolicus]|jgi:hypothetical protein|uniref:hypothetical protein n=1 Tax=Pseudomaricurvus alkylphenolicus TaxID=1306991 RepID=UPI001423F652|nr:hypothetical protein [Pseudomaricurvus alkylphenolicus]NIB41288.1 hypothetical protein [Pseudomaricurvus alkylphenolicus]